MPLGEAKIDKYGSATMRLNGDALTLAMLDAFSVDCAARGVPSGSRVSIDESGGGIVVIVARWTTEEGADHA